MSTLTSRDLCVGMGLLSLFLILSQPDSFITNLLPERSTTRLHAPPGGKSSFSLTHDEGVAKPITTTPIKETGNGQEQWIAKSTLSPDNNDGDNCPASKRVRVMQPPGGFSSFTLG